jgi:protein gp37
MQKTKIDWPWKPLYTFNPIVGCKHGCGYCYAKTINNRFHYIKKWNEPQFFQDRLYEPVKRQKPTNIFVGSMCDLFGDWVHEIWIKAIIGITKKCPQHTFFFLTKNPKRYKEFYFPENCWLGATVTGKQTGEDWPNNLKNDAASHLYNLPNKTFLSIEPLLGSFEGYVFTNIDQIIVGAMTGPGAVKPKREWIESIKHPNIYYKNNIKEVISGTI